jgi:succinoglycan biosynthesis transport protein ExoP
MPRYELNLRDYYRIVRRHIIVIAAVAIGLGGLSFMLTEQVPTYRARATVRIQRASDMTSFLLETFYWSPEDNISTQVRLINSQPVLLKVAQKMDPSLTGLKLEQIVTTRRDLLETLGTLSGQISAQQVESTGLVDIIATILDPDRSGTASERATTLAQYTADAFREYSDEQAGIRTREARNFIEEQLGEVQSRLEISQDSLQSFLEENLDTATADVSGLSVLIDRQRNLLSRIGLLGEQLRRLRSGDFSLPSAGSSIDPAAVSYQVEAFRQLTDLLNRRADLLVTYTPRAPAVRALEARIEEVRGEIRTTLRMDQVSLQSQLDSLNVLLRAYPQEEIRLATLRRAVELNTQLVEQLQTRLQEIRIQENQKSGEVTIVNYPTTAWSDQQGGKGLKTVVGLMLGLMLGVLLAFLLESMDTSIGTIEDVEEYLELPVLAVIPHLGVDKVAARLVQENLQLKDDPNLDMYARLIPQYDPKSPAAEAYRTLRTNLQFATAAAETGEERKNTFVFTSSSLQEGKTTTIINLAITMAQAGSRVLLMGCNMRRPTLYKSFGVPRERGMTDILTGQLPWRECVKTVTDMMVGPLSLQSVMSMPGLDNLHLITAGGIPPNPSELLNSPRFAELIAEVRKEFDYVIVDCPPILPVTDAAVVGRQVDWSVLIYQVGKVPRNALRRARTHLQNVGGHVLGIAMNDVRAEISGYSPYSQYMTKYYGEEKKGRKTLLQRVFGRFRRGGPGREKGAESYTEMHADLEHSWIDVPYHDQTPEKSAEPDRRQLERLPYSRISSSEEEVTGPSAEKSSPDRATAEATGRRSLLDRIPLWAWLVALLVVIVIIVLSLLGVWSGGSTAAVPSPTIRVLAESAPPPGPPTPTSVWSVQAGSFQTEAEARRLVRGLEASAELAAVGIWTRSEEVPGLGTWHRVWVGRFTGKEEGEAAAEQVRRTGLSALALLRSTSAPLP